MNIKYDKVADAVYMQVSQAAVAQTVKLDDTLIVDKDSGGNIVGLEILDASSQEDLIKNLEGNVLNGVPVDMISSTPIAA